MKEKNDFIVLLLGYLTSMIVGLFLGSLDLILFLLKRHISIISSMPDPFITPLFTTLVSSHLVECFCGAIVVGYFSKGPKGRGMVLGVITSYIYLFIGVILFWVTDILIPQFKRANITIKMSVLDQYWLSLLYATVVFIGLIGGRAGELLRRKSK